MRLTWQPSVTCGCSATAEKWRYPNQNRAMPLAAMRALLATALLLAALGACANSSPKVVAGEAATWTVNSKRPPMSDARAISALVSRVECASGVTGHVLAPVVNEQKKRVVVTFTVERNADGDATCPGNKSVEQTFKLHSPLGERPLFDGTCFNTRHPTCEPHQVWPSKK